MWDNVGRTLLFRLHDIWIGPGSSAIGVSPLLNIAGLPTQFRALGPSQMWNCRCGSVDEPELPASASPAFTDRPTRKALPRRREGITVDGGEFADTRADEYV